MSAGAPTKTLLTTEELLALPDDDTDRELIRGELREKPVTRRNRRHSRSMARLARLLDQWLDQLPAPRGEVLVGDAGFRLARDPDITVGVDIAYVSAETAAKTPDNAWLYDGPPVLAVEILSPSDTQEGIAEKVEIYKQTGVAVIWLVDPIFQTVLVLRPGVEPELFNARQDLPGGPELPGFRVPVAEIFGRIPPQEG